MKKALGLAVLMLFAVSTAQAQVGSISGSSHDFSVATWNGTGEICVVCHAPHNNQNASTDLLWNRDPSAVASYNMYANTAPTFQATIAAQPQAESKVCLSCHDGTVALASFGGGDPVTNTEVIGTNYPLADVGSDLSNDHPISITYDGALATADGGLVTPDNVDGLAGTSALMPLFGAGKDQLECATCHDVHNNVPSGNTYLLYVENTGSDTCLDCHTK